MKHKRLNGLLLTACLIAVSCEGQEADAVAVLEKLRSAYGMIRDYQVEVTVKVNVDFVKIPVRRATMYFKQPDRVRFRTTGFTLMPKRGSSFNPSEFLSGKYTAIFAGAEETGGNKTLIIKVIPLGSESSFVLSTLWVDTARQLVRKAEVNTREGGTYHMLMEYGSSQYPLPARLTVSFSVARIDIPVAISGDLTSEKEKAPKDKGGMTKGTVVITYTNYRVNQGLSDSLFGK